MRVYLEVIVTDIRAGILVAIVNLPEHAAYGLVKGSGAVVVEGTGQEIPVKSTPKAPVRRKAHHPAADALPVVFRNQIQGVETHGKVLVKRPFRRADDKEADRLFAILQYIHILARLRHILQESFRMGIIVEIVQQFIGVDSSVCALPAPPPHPCQLRGICDLRQSYRYHVPSVLSSLFILTS